MSEANTSVENVPCTFSDAKQLKDFAFDTQDRFAKETNKRLEFFDNPSIIEDPNVRNNEFVSDQLFQIKKDVLQFECSHR